MTRISKRIINWILGAFAFISLALGVVFTMPQAETAKAADTAVTFNAAYLEGDSGERSGYLQIRMDTNGKTWTNSKNGKQLSELDSTITDYTTINGRTLTELQNACPSDLPVLVTLQPANAFSFIRIWVPLDFMTTSDIYSFGVLDGWAYNDGNANYTSVETTFLRSSSTMVLAENYTTTTTYTSDTLTISEAQLKHRLYDTEDFESRGADSYVVDITIGKTYGEYDIMYNGYKYLRNAIYINGKSIEEWNTQMIAADARYNDPSTYTYFPQNSTAEGHATWFAKPVGLWGTSTGFRLTIFRELVADVGTITVSVGAGAYVSGGFMVAETVQKTVWTQEVVNITDKLTFLDNTHNVNSNNTTNSYHIYTNNESCWTSALGCFNEYDAYNAGGGQIQMKYIYFNGSALWDINANDNNSYGSEQSNIASGGIYAPILVTMTNELGSSLKLTVPMAYTNGKDAHEEIIIKKGFSVYENGVSYYVSNDVVFTNNNGTWTKEVKPIEYETEVMGIQTRALSKNENFIIFQISNNDYDGCSTTELTDISSLYGYIKIGATTFSSYSGEKFFNIWGVENSVAFRFSSATELQQVPFITIKAGAKFPSYATQNGAPLSYFVTTEDITFIHDVSNDTWTVGNVSDIKYTVTYTVDGATYSTEEVAYGDMATAPTAPEKAEDENYTYTFDCWTLDGAEYDFSTAVTSDITLVAEFTETAKETASTQDITSALSFVDQGSNANGDTETYLIKMSSLAWANISTGRINKDYPDALNYIYFNGTSIAEINAASDEAYGSSFATITGNADCAPIAVLYGQTSTYSYIQIWVPTAYPNDGTAEENHESIEIKSGFSITQDDVTYAVSQDIKWVNLNGSWYNADAVFAEGEAVVTIENPRIGGTANELYMVDITSDSWTITCNNYDFMYASYAAARKLIFINGVSIYDINANTDDSAYTYSTYPMTGVDDSLFAHPVFIYTDAQGEVDSQTLTLWIHKTYMQTLGNDITITIGAGYNTFTTDGLALAEDVNYDMVASVKINNGTYTTTEYVIKGECLTQPSTPQKEMTQTEIYTFDNWYIVGGDTIYDFSSVITEDIAIEARFTTVSVVLSETGVEQIYYYYRETTDADGNVTIDRWLIFYLSNHDYPTDTAMIYDGVLAETQRIGIYDNIVIKGTTTDGTATEATLASLGYGEAVYMNIWNTDYYGTIAFRVPGISAITEVVIKEGAFFPSYAYVTGATTDDTRYLMTKEITLVNTSDNGLDGVLVAQADIVMDIQMETGASIRLVDNGTERSGIRFETKIAEESIAELKQIANDYPVEFGTLIVPKDYLMGGLFTHEWLNSVYGEGGYIDIKSTARVDDTGYEFPKNKNGYHSYFGSIVKLNNANYNREFVGIGYIAIDFEEGRTYIYADYDSTNARSASFIANAAINDRSASEDSEYKYYTENNNYSPYTSTQRTFLETYITWTETSAINNQVLTSLANKGGEDTVAPTTQKLAGPYVELLYSTNVNVWGKFTYTDGNKTATEDFYLQAGTTSHKQYLDLFRVNGVGYGMDSSNLSMTSITFTNAELEQTKTGVVKVIALYSQNKTIDTENQEIYVTVAQDNGSEMTVGAHLGLGGSLTYLAKSGIYEGVAGQDEYNSWYQSYWGYTKYKSGTGNVVLSNDTSVFDDSHGTGYKTSEAGYYGHATSSMPAYGAVNLINNFDAGRQIQQSWYAQVGNRIVATDADGNTTVTYDGEEGKGYSRAYCYTESSEGKYWPYNPVQAGDVVSNPSQIIDYEVNEAKGYIYVKTRAMDWAKGYDSETECENAIEGGSTTKSYMENYYRLSSDGTVTVNNSFVDWNGFTDMELCDWASTELPAVYPIQSLNYYVSNLDGDGSWTDDLEYKNDLASWSVSAEDGNACRQYANASQGNTKVEEWFAWANGSDENAIGLGMYIPNVATFVSGRSVTSTATSEAGNVNAFSNILLEKDLMSNMQSIQYTYQGAYVSNTSYTAPGVLYRMEAYKPIEYSYMLCVDTVANIRSTFKEVKDSGRITNAGDAYQKVGLDAWARSDKKWTW